MEEDARAEIESARARVARVAADLAEELPEASDQMAPTLGGKIDAAKVAADAVAAVAFGPQGADTHYRYDASGGRERGRAGFRDG